jgi:hypothetical protein
LIHDSCEYTVIYSAFDNVSCEYKTSKCAWYTHHVDSMEGAGVRVFGEDYEGKNEARCRDV